jgi:hypothetical protein
LEGGEWQVTGDETEGRGQKPEDRGVVRHLF